MSIQLLPSGNYRLQVRRSNLKVNQTYPSRSAAEKALAVFEGRPKGSKATRKASGLTLDEAWSMYLTSRDFVEKRPNTKNTEESHVRPVLLKLGSRAVKSLVADDIDNLIVKQIKAGQAANTVRLSVAALSSVLNFCRKKALVTSNVCLGIKRPTTLPKADRMPQGHQGALMKAMAHPKYRFRASARLVLLVRETGARPGEWANAKWEWVNFEKEKIIFQNTKYKREARTVPLNKAAAALLCAQLEDLTIGQFDTFATSEWIFPVVGRDGELHSLAYSGTLRDMKDEKILPKGLHAHSGRHEYISSLVESSDLDDSRIMSLVGHHSPTSMEVYKSARNIRFLPQIEALEQGRRVERTQELGKALGVPTKLIESYLVMRRKAQEKESLDDTGDELLYETESLEKLSMMAARLGTDESSRIKKLLEIRDKAAKRK